MAQPRPERRRLFVSPEHGRWKVQWEGGQVESWHETQADAIRRAKELVRSLPEGDLAQVLVQRADGRFRVEWTVWRGPLRRPPADDRPAHGRFRRTHRPSCWHSSCVSWTSSAGPSLVRSTPRGKDHTSYGYAYAARWPRSLRGSSAAAGGASPGGCRHAPFSTGDTVSRAPRWSANGRSAPLLLPLSGAGPLPACDTR